MINPLKQRKIVSFLILISFTILTFAENSSFVSGSVKGISSASYFFKTSYQMKNFEADGFKQVCEKKVDGYLIKVEAKADSLDLREPFFLNKDKIKKIKGGDKQNGERIILTLSKENSIDGAIYALIKEINETYNYVEKNDESLGIDEILKEKSLSCLSFCRLTKFYLDLLKIPSQIVIGIKFNPQSETFNLKGGALHSWLIVEVNNNKKILVDPLFSFGFVTEYYIFLDYFDDFTKEKKNKLKDCNLKLIENSDRIFYNPESPQNVTFFRRTRYEQSSPGVVIGKVLKENDLPCFGKIIIKSGEKFIESNLFNGNFAFFVEVAGVYKIGFISDKGEKKFLGEIEFRNELGKKVVFYLKDAQNS
jgi:hypothetical protein